MAKAVSSSKEAVVETRDADEFSTILKQSFKPRSDRAATEVENAVTTLVKEALSDTSVIKDDVLDTIDRLAQLHQRGVLTEEEFKSKKAELLGRL